MKKSLTSQGLSLVNAALAVLSLAIICVSLYLIKHFFDANFPESLDAASSALCSISSFLNCDSATYSPMAHFFGVPTGVFGLVFGICILIGVFSNSEKMEQQNKLLSIINGAGCLVFLAYSVVVLKTLCPFCTVYYVLSWIVLGIYWTQSKLPLGIQIFHGGWQILVLALFGGIFSYNYHNSKNHQDKISEKIIAEFNRLADLGSPKIASPYFINKTEQAPKVTISIFSDFQCPYCKKISDQMHEIARRFKQDLQIDYYFFPLDPSCNPEVKSNIHGLACAAAQIASCDSNKFLTVHDEIFADQANLSDQVLSSIKEKNGITTCPPQEEFLTLMQGHVEVAKSYNVKSTPTFILNGRKIEGLVPSNHLSALISHLIKNANAH
jgi:protein-disulfide isomerase/uncharacterized membrane protein